MKMFLRYLFGLFDLFPLVVGAIALACGHGIMAVVGVVLLGAFFPMLALRIDKLEEQ
jgi:hypothetical protein